MEGHTGSEEGLLTVDLAPLGDHAAILKLEGEIDLSTTHLLSEQLSAVAQSSYTGVVIDATGVSFMDSTGLHALVEGKRLIHEAGKHIYLVPSSQVRRVLELVFPEPLFADRMDDLDQAIKAATADSPA
jgi:anti-anti-sigma factor